MYTYLYAFKANTNDLNNSQINELMNRFVNFDQFQPNRQLNIQAC